jgi:hypothetical protein
VDLRVHLECLAQVVQENVSLNVVVQGVSDIRENEEASEEMNKYFVENGVFGQCLEDGLAAVSQYAEELHDEALGLRIIEDGRVVEGEEDELEIGVVDDLLNFADVQVVVDVFEFEAELQVLIVEDADLRLRVVEEDLNHSGRVDKIGLEEDGQGLRLSEDLLMACELGQ